VLTLTDLLITASEAIREGLRRMTVNRVGVLFVCDNDAHIVGVLSDGDVRRALLEGTLLMSPVEKVMNTDPIAAATVDEATQLLRKLALAAVPVLEDTGRVSAVVVEDKDQVLILRGEPHFPTSGQPAALRSVVAIIPARGGSKRIPRKNLARVGGKTLLARTIEAARGARSVSHVLVSTDDRQIADEARAHGIAVPWLRPEHLAADDTPTIEVLMHATTWALENLVPSPEFGVLLEPTAPFRTVDHIEDALELLLNSDADCVASVSQVPHVLNPEELLTLDGSVLRPYIQSQTLDTRRLRGLQREVYVQNGLVYAFRVRSLLQWRSLYGKKTLALPSSWEDFVDIDTPEDLVLANLRSERLASHSSGRSAE